MKDNLIFLPVVIQIALTFWLYIYLAIAKSRASKQGMVNEDRRGLHDDAWPDNVVQINNCIRNQFEIPILFYILTVLLWLTNSINIYMHALMWVFVVSRLFHAFIHVGSNYVPLRRKVFMVGCLLLIAVTLFISYSILSGVVG